MPEMNIAPAPQPTETQPLPMNATPDQFGAGVFGEVAQGAAQAYAGMEQRRQIDLKNEMDAQAGHAQVAIAQFQARMSDVENAVRTDASIPANGYRAEVLRQFDAAAPSITAGISNQNVIRMVQDQLGELRARTNQSAGDYQTVTLGKMAWQNAVHADDANTSLAAQMVDPADVRMVQNRAGDMWHSLADLTPDQRHLGTMQSAEKIGIAYAWGAVQRDPVAALKALDDGTMVSLGVPGEQIHVLRRSAEAGIKGIEAEARAQQAAAKAQFNQQYSIFIGRAHDGEDIKPVEAASLSQQALSFGEADKAREIGRALEDQGFAKQYRTMAANPAAMQQHIAELGAKAHPSPVEQRELAWAQEHASGLASRFSGDPVGYLATYGPRGTQPPPLDMNDPKSMVARANWAGVATSVTGQTITPLSEAEMAPMRKAIAQGPAGRLEALQQLDALPAVARAQWARAIMPNDKLFQQEAMLAPGVRDLVHSGKIIQEGNQGYWPSNSMNLPDQRKSAQQLTNFDAMIANTLRNVDAETVVAVQQNMRNYLAGKFKSQGKANAHQITGADLREAATYAFGGQMKNGQQYGGGMLWREPQGFVVAPENMTGAQFFNAIRADLAAQVKAGHGPVEPNGHDFDLKKATPVFIGNGVYRWETGTGPNASIVLNKKGQPYITRIGGQ